MVLRYHIGFERTEERFCQLVDFLKRTGIHRVILFSATFYEQSSIISEEYYRNHVKLLRPYMERLRAMGVETGINMLYTIGHAYYADEKEYGFRRAVTIEGKTSRGCVCMRDKNFIQYIKRVYGYYAALEPSVIFADDDIRAFSLGQMTCFCGEHMKLLSERVGEKVNREEVRKHLFSKEFGSNEIKEAYFEQVKEDIEYVINEIAESVRLVSPKTEIGIMTTSYPVVTLDRNLHEFFERFYEKNVTRIRMGMDFYREGAHNEIPLKFSMPLIQREIMDDARVEIQPEIENDTYGFFYKSNSITHMQVVWCLTNGLQNLQLNLFDSLDCPSPNYDEITESFRRNMKFYNRLTKLIPEGYRTSGVAVYVNPESLRGRRAKAGELIYESNWHQWLQLDGIPLSTDQMSSSWVFLTGDDIVLASEEQIDTFLKKGAVMDLSAIEALVYRGYGERIGVVKIEAMDRTFAGERFTDSEFNGEYGGCHNSHYFYSSLHSEEQVQRITYAQGAIILSNIIDHHQQIVGNGVTLYENPKGERFCMIPMDHNIFSQFQNVGNKRKYQLIRAFEWIARKELPIYCKNEKVCVNINQFDNYHVITLFNLSSDEITNPQIKYHIMGRLKYLDCNGVLKELQCEECDGDIVIKKKVKALGILVIVDERRNDFI